MSSAHTCSESVSLLREEKLKIEIVLFSFPSIKILAGRLCPPVSYLSSDFTRTRCLQPGCWLLTAAGLCAIWLALQRAQAAEDGSLRRPADRPKAGCQLCQDDRQAVGCRLNRGEHCVLYLFILSAGGGPDPPWPASASCRQGRRERSEKGVQGNLSTRPWQRAGIHFHYI